MAVVNEIRTVWSGCLCCHEQSQGKGGALLSSPTFKFTTNSSFLTLPLSPSHTCLSSQVLGVCLNQPHLWGLWATASESVSWTGKCFSSYLSPQQTSLSLFGFSSFFLHRVKPLFSSPSRCELLCFPHLPVPQQAKQLLVPAPAEGSQSLCGYTTLLTINQILAILSHWQHGRFQEREKKNKKPTQSLHIWNSLPVTGRSVSPKDVVWLSGWMCEWRWRESISSWV